MTHFNGDTTSYADIFHQGFKRKAIEIVAENARMAGLTPEEISNLIDDAIAKLHGAPVLPDNLQDMIEFLNTPEARKHKAFDGEKCFAAGTLVSLPDGTTTPIEKLTHTLHVASFDDGIDAGRSALHAGKVVKLYHNVTQEFLRLSFADGREPLVVTPGHAFLDGTGEFTKIGELVEAGNGSARVVDQTGEVIEVSAELLRFGEATADLFERSSTRSVFVDGKCVLKEDVSEGWKTYNFEVESLHTYVAGGVRVHNDSGFLGQVGNTIDDKLFDKLGVLWDGIGDIVTSPFHVAGEILEGAKRAVDAIGTGISKGISRFGKGYFREPRRYQEPCAQRQGRKDAARLRLGCQRGGQCSRTGCHALQAGGHRLLCR